MLLINNYNLSSKKKIYIFTQEGLLFFFFLIYSGKIFCTEVLVVKVLLIGQCSPSNQ
jgi:hypothetical protein